MKYWHLCCRWLFRLIAFCLMVLWSLIIHLRTFHISGKLCMSVLWSWCQEDTKWLFAEEDGISELHKCLIGYYKWLWWFCSKIHLFKILNNFFNSSCLYVITKQRFNFDLEQSVRNIYDIVICSIFESVTLMFVVRFRFYWRPHEGFYFHWIHPV